MAGLLGNSSTRSKQGRGLEMDVGSETEKTLHDRDVPHISSQNQCGAAGVVLLVRVSALLQ